MLSEKKKTSGKSVYITVVMVLAVLAAIVVLSSQNRTEKKQSTETETKKIEVTEKITVTEAPKVTEASKETEVAATESPAPAEPVDAVPETLVLPAHGALSKRHDTETLVYSLTMGDYRTHTGIDIVATVGSPVYAASDGKVLDIWSDPMMGNCLSVEHSGGMVTVYKNLSPDLPAGITVGVPVGEGEIIGSVGESALIESADESHLHFEITVNGTPVNPTDYLSSFTSAEVEE